MEGSYSEEHYAAYTDSQMNAELVGTVTRKKGYFIYPSQLFAQVVGMAESNPNLNTELAAIFTAIEAWPWATLGARRQVFLPTSNEISSPGVHKLHDSGTAINQILDDVANDIIAEMEQNVTAPVKKGPFHV